MSVDWLITIPVWGPRCHDALATYALPAILAASQRVSGRLRFVVHTDRPFEIDEVLAQFERRILPVPKGHDVHDMASNANREALGIARTGECVAFINADMVPSIEVFAAAERRFAEGKRLIMMAASRTFGGIPPIGAASADLLDWTMAFPHPAIVECCWPSGHTSIPWAIYFERGDDIVLHGFHLHPFALLKDRETPFKGTIDLDLPDNYTADEMHLITDRDEASFAELSPLERNFPLVPYPMTAENIAEWAHRHARPAHRRLFERRITIKGNGADIGDGAICEDILRRLAA